MNNQFGLIEKETINANNTKRALQATAFDVNGLNKAAEVVKFPKPYKQRWICNLSQHFRFNSVNKYFLQIQETENYSQFDIICKLLRLGNCDYIYFDSNLSTQQLETIRHLQSLSSTVLINAKQAFLFSNAQYDYA